MCRTLNIPRSLVYYKKKTRVHNTKLENAVISIFRESKNNYGSRKIKIELKKQNIVASRRKIRETMDKYRLVSNYTVKQYKVHKSSCNEEKVGNIVNREFDDRSDLEIVVSDLTYVNVVGKWHYICLLINLFNREIAGYSAGHKKDAELVYEEFMSTNINLTKEYDFVCLKENGDLLTADSIKYLSRVINYELNIPFKFHSLRHTHATMLLEAGANIKDIQKRLGHSKSSITMDVYSHATKKMTNDTVNLFETIISTKLPTT